MHVLMIKTSSLGDIIHCFEGMLECYHHRPDIVFDWVVASNFSELPKLLPNVRKVIEINERQWRRNILQPKTWQSLKESILRLKQDNYDVTVDAQGRFRSALLGHLSRTSQVWGFGTASLSQSLKSYFKKPQSKKFNQQPTMRLHKLISQMLSQTLRQHFYHHLVHLQEQHKPSQFRKLLSAVFEYPSDLNKSFFITPSVTEHHKNTILLFPNTSSEKKTWKRWNQLAEQFIHKGFKVCVLNGSEKEYQKNQALIPLAQNIAPTSLKKVMEKIMASKLCIGVDTGLTHFACILKHPCVSLFGQGVTSPDIYAIPHAKHRVIYQNLSFLSVEEVVDFTTSLLVDSM